MTPAVRNPLFDFFTDQKKAAAINSTKMQKLVIFGKLFCNFAACKKIKCLEAEIGESALGHNHMGASINYVSKILPIFYPLPPPYASLLHKLMQQHRQLVNPPPPCLVPTQFIDAPFVVSKKTCILRVWGNLQLQGKQVL